MKKLFPQIFVIYSAVQDSERNHRLRRSRSENCPSCQFYRVSNLPRLRNEDRLALREAVDPLSEGALGWRRLGGRRREVHARIVMQAPRYRQHDGPRVLGMGARGARPLAYPSPAQGGSRPAAGRIYARPLHGLLSTTELDRGRRPRDDCGKLAINSA